MSKRYAYLMLIVGLLVSSCGAAPESATEATVGAGSEIGESSTTTTLIVAPDQPRPPVSHVVEDPVGLFSSNPNDPSTPMGALCWASWEVERVMVATIIQDVLEDSGDDRVADLDVDIMAALAAATDPVLRELATSGDLPADFRPFAKELFAMFDDALEFGVEDFANAFDFEGLENAEEYYKTASAHKECVVP